MMRSTAANQGRGFQLRVALQFWTLAAVLRPLKHVVPLPLLVRAVRLRGQSRRYSGSRAAAIVQYMGATDRFPRRPPGNCLERSLAAYRLLLSAGARPELRVGVRRGDDTGAVMKGHVWLVLDGQPVAESTSAVEGFTPILRFDADGFAERLGPPPAPTSPGRATLWVP